MKIKYTAEWFELASNFEDAMAQIRKEYPEAAAFQSSEEIYSKEDINFSIDVPIVVWYNDSVGHDDTEWMIAELEF